MSPSKTGQIGSRIVVNKITFESVSNNTNNVTVLGSLVFDLKVKLGPKAFIDLTKITSHQGLARDLIASLYCHASPGRISSDNSLSSYKEIIKDLLAYCETLKLPNDIRMIDINSEFLLNFRAHLKTKYIDLKSDSCRRRFGNLLRLIESSQDLGLINIELCLPRNFKHIRDNDRTQPYSAAEALDIEAACREHIREMLHRLEEGQSQLSKGKDPQILNIKRDKSTGRMLAIDYEDRAWNQLPNLLWYVVNRLKGQYLKRQELTDMGHYSYINAICGVYNGIYRAPDIYGKLYPLAYDLIPFIILLAKKTGRNEASILNLKRDCLTEINGRYILRYEKLRGHCRMYTKSINDDGPFSPVALIKTLQNITSTLSTLCPAAYQNHLFLGLTIHGKGREPIKPLDPSYIKYQMNNKEGWCAKQKLLDCNYNLLKISLRSMRVYYLTERYKKTGQLSKVSNDAAHTLQNTTVSYLENESMKDSHEQAIVSGIQAARRLAKPTVISTDMELDIVAENTQLNKETVAGILKGNQDVFFASCKDFFNKPGGAPNKPCDKPWGCFTCPNAIITRHVLPRVIAFRNFMRTQKNELASGDWQIKFGLVWNVITYDILPKFTPDVILEAETLANDQILYIPIALSSGDV